MCLGCFRALAIVNNAVTNLGILIIFDILVLFPLDIFPEVGLLDHIITLFLIFWGTSIPFSIVAASIYIPTNSALMFPFLHILSKGMGLVIFGLKVGILDNAL